jgi:aryl-alcohol dehydrogenase-like predicted oxidoreductase
MNYRTLGKTGLRVSEIGLGTMVHAGHFGPMDDKESLSAIETALDLGVNFIDTSDAYGAGYSETLLGKALKGKRDKVILATKGGNVMVGPNRGKTDFSVSYIAQVMDESLKRLQTDYIDLYQLHNPTVDVIEREDIWELLEQRKKEGKIRHYGVSINKVEEGTAAIDAGKAESIQIEFSLILQEPKENLFSRAQKADVGIIARAPLRRSLLSGKFKAEDQSKFQGEDVRARNFRGDLFAKELAKVESFRFLGGQGRTLAQAAIAFCLAFDAVSVVIAGARNAAQIRANAAAADIRLLPDELAKADAIWRQGLNRRID